MLTLKRLVQSGFWPPALPDGTADVYAITSEGKQILYTLVVKPKEADVVKHVSIIFFLLASLLLSHLVPGEAGDMNGDGSDDIFAVFSEGRQVLYTLE